MKNIVIINGHSKKGSFNEAIANTYLNQKMSEGYKVELLNLYELNFDPILRVSYKENESLQPLEDDLKKASEKIKEAHHLVFIYPVWWGNMPALLKGFIDRVFIPGFAFRYHKKGTFWDKLLQGKTASIITTSDSPKFWLWFVNWNSPTRVLKKAVLDFCGVKTTTTLNFGPLRFKTQLQRQKILERVKTLKAPF